MPLKHITGHIYAHRDDIRKVEGFPLTLLIKVTLTDGSVHERYVTEQRIKWWTSEEGLRRRADEWKRSWRRISYGDANLPSYPGRVHTREEAFDFELSAFIKELRK